MREKPVPGEQGTGFYQHPIMFRETKGFKIKYVARFLAMLLGCVIIAFGAYFEVVADVTMLPADGFTRRSRKYPEGNFQQ